MKRGTQRSDRVAPTTSHWRRLRPAPVVLLALLSAAAWAADAPGPRLAVVEFRVAVGGAPDALGLALARMTSDALAASGRYDVVPQATVQAKADEHRLRPPFAVGHLQLLADAVDAALMIHGSVRALTCDPDSGAASVVLAVEMVDGASGESKRRVEASGKLPPAGPAPRDEALLRAAALAVEQVAEGLTGVKVGAAQAPPPPGAAVALSPGIAAPLMPALLPATTPAADQPLTSAPTQDLAARPATTPSPSPVAEAVEEPPAPEPEPAEASVIPEPESFDLDGAPPRVEVKVLARLSADRILVTLGKDAIVTPKMDLEVYRITYPRGGGEPTRQRIGRLKVVKINATDAEARVVEGGAIMRTGDVGYGQ